MAYIEQVAKRSLIDNKYLDKKWKNRHSKSGYRCPSGLQFGGYWTPDNIPAKVRKDSKNTELRKYWKEWIDCDLELESDIDINMYNDHDDYDDIPIWNCSICTYINIERLAFCSMCNHPYNFNPIETKPVKYTNGYKVNNKIKQKRYKRKKWRRDTNEKFEVYWNEMKQHNVNLKKKEKLFASRLLDAVDKKSLNFNLVFLPTECGRRELQLHGIEMNEILFEDIIRVKTHPHGYSSYSRLTMVKLIIAHHTTHRNYNNFHKVNCSMFIYSYGNWKDFDWLKIVKQWKNENINNVEEFIVPKIYFKKGFEYLSSHSLFQSIGITEKKEKINIRMNIKLDQFAGIGQYNYMKDIVITKDLCFDQVPFKLKNFMLRECSVELFQNDSYIPLCFTLKPADNQSIYIPIHVAEDETVNNAIENKLKFRHELCLVQLFASKCVAKLLVLEKKVKQTYFYGYYDRKITFKSTEWKYDECHDPNCNLLPLTCDLNRVLTEYMPYYDVLKDVLIPYIGYDIVYYVKLEAKNVEYYEFNHDIMNIHQQSEEGYIDGFFDKFGGFNRPQIIVDKQVKNDDTYNQYEDTDDSTRSESAAVPNLFGDDFWSESESD